MNRMNRANCCEVKPVQPDPGKQNSVPKLPNRNVDSTFSNQDKKKLRPPDKKNIDAHLNRIRLKEKELKSCNSECEFIREEMKTLQPNRCLLNEEKQKNNLDLKTLREEIRLKNNNLSRLESGLTYKNEHKINEAIKKLELQLTCNNFKMREKKKILAEIDSLKTSKKSLVNYLAQKREIDELREQQLKKRRENEQYHQQVSNLIFKEDEMRSRLNTLQTTIENLLLELNDLNEQKKILLSDYKKREKDHNVMKDAIRKKNRQNSKCKEDDERQQLSHRKNREEIHFQHTSEEEECIQHCNTLIRYLQHFPVADLGHTYQAQTPSEETAAAASLGSSAEIQGDHDATYVLLKKNDGCEDFFFGAGRRQKKNKKGRKFSATKSLIHSPEVFAQFEKLEMSVPASMAEILPALNQLEGKKKYFECLKKQREKNLMPLNRVSESSIEQDDVCLSDSGYSADGSAACELSRQVSHTESIDDSSSNVSLLEIINLMQTESSAQNEHSLWSASSLSSASNKDDGLGIFREDENVLQKTSDGLGRLAQVSQDLPVVAGCPAENEVFLLDKREVSLKTESQPEAAAASGDQTSTKPKSETSDLRPVVLNDPCPKELQCCERLFSKNPAEMPSADGRDISISGDISKSKSRSSSSSSSTSSSSSSNCSDDLSERVSRDFKALANVAKSKRVMNFPPMTDISCDLKGMEYEALTSPSGLRFTKRTALDRSLDGESSSSDNEEDRNARVEEEVDQEDAERPNQGPVAGGDDDDNNNNNDEGEENDEVQEEEEEMEEDEKKAEEETTDNSDSEKYNEKSETVGDSEYGNDNTDDDDGKNLEDEERGLWKKI